MLIPHGRGDHFQVERLKVGLDAVYGWYERNAELAGCVLRDVEYHPVTKKIVGLWFGPSMAAYQDPSLPPLLAGAYMSGLSMAEYGFLAPSVPVGMRVLLVVLPEQVLAIVVSIWGPDNAVDVLPRRFSPVHTRHVDVRLVVELD